MFQNELDQVKAQLSLKGEFLQPAGDQQLLGSTCALVAWPGLRSPVQRPPLSEAEGMVQAASCFTEAAASSELFLRREHLQ